MLSEYVKIKYFVVYSFKYRMLEHCPIINRKAYHLLYSSDNKIIKGDFLSGRNYYIEYRAIETFIRKCKRNVI